MNKIIFSSLICFSLFASPLTNKMEMHVKNNQIEDLTTLILERGGGLKRDGDWDKHIEYSEQAIKWCKKEGKPLQLASIANQVASTYFYKGEFSICRQKALDAYEIYTSEGNNQGIVTSLYLLSAASRGLKEYQADISFGSIALEMLKESKLNIPELEGKVLYNLAAAYMDMPSPDAEKAGDLLKGALTKFESDSPYSIRVQMRLAKVLYLKKETSQAYDILNAVGAKITQKRMKMHYYFLLSQVFHQKGEKALALRNNEKATKIAYELKAKSDLRRYQEWILELKGN